MELDGQILLWIQDYLRAPWLDAIMTRITVLGDHGILWILVTLALLSLAYVRNRCNAVAIRLMFVDQFANIVSLFTHC